MMSHILSIKQFQVRKTLDRLIAAADNFADMEASQYPNVLEHKVFATLFYEPSTRTRLSFESAILRLGGKVTSTESAGHFSSAAKGETLEDTIRTISAYTDGIVIRHGEVGTAERAAAVSDVPIINAGDGIGEHPTQALLDLYTIQKSKDHVDGLTIGLVGDLLNGRTIHSLLQLLKLYKVTLYCIAPDSLQLPAKYQKILEEAGTSFSLAPNWDAVIGKLDVLYMTRVQKERFASAEDYDAVKDSFVFGQTDLKRLKKDAIIMHPLPRVNEIAPEVDADPRAIYFDQVKNGLFMRMALLQHVFSELGPVQ